MWNHFERGGSYGVTSNVSSPNPKAQQTAYINFQGDENRINTVQFILTKQDLKNLIVDLNKVLEEIEGVQTNGSPG